MMSTITLLNIIDLRTTLFTETLRKAYSTAPIIINDWPIKLVYKLRTDPLNKCQPLPAPYKRLIHDIYIKNEQKETDQSRPT